MRKRKKPRKNYRKGPKARRRFKIFGRLLLGFKLTAGLITVAAMTGFFILVHDLLTQCDYFRATNLTIEGVRRLTTEQVAIQARVHPGVNILAVNLSLVRKRLLAHPWIADAEVSREIPSGICIRVSEHTPLAVVDVGRKFIMNHRGNLFKEWDASDPPNLPVVSGLNVSDLPVHGRPYALGRNGKPQRTVPFNAVMQVLRLGEQPGSILPNRLVKRIRVDRQIGLTLFAFNRGKRIHLGYDDYAGKYHMLAKSFSYLKHQRRISDFDRIDLNNLHRVVINPIKIESRRKGS